MHWVPNEGESKQGKVGFMPEDLRLSLQEIQPQSAEKFFC